MGAISNFQESCDDANAANIFPCYDVHLANKLSTTASSSLLVFATASDCLCLRSLLFTVFARRAMPKRRGGADISGFHVVADEVELYPSKQSSTIGSLSRDLCDAFFVYRSTMGFRGRLWLLLRLVPLALLSERCFWLFFGFLKCR